VCVAFFAGANWLIEALEDQGVVDTHDPDDRVLHLAERIWERRDDAWQVTNYGAESFVRDSFPATGDGPRVFLVGGSWALGTPYDYQGRPPKPGTISSFLEAWLRRELGPTADVVNAGAGAQNSHRVVQVAEEALTHDPDALIVATCNNEGALPPNALRGWLEEQGGYRLLEKLLATGDEPARTMFTAQASAIDEVARAYEANLEAIVTAAAEADVPVVLATLPIHLLYEGLDEGHHAFPAEDPWYHGQLPAFAEELPAPDWLSQVEPCGATLMLQEAHEWTLSLATAKRCQVKGHAVPMSILASRARFHLKRETELDRQRLTTHFGECVLRGLTELRDGIDGAADTLSSCDEGVDEAIRWSGLAAARAGDVERARQLLRRSVEVHPRNRCRPSFNEIVRSVAGRHDHVVLADLERDAERLAPDGLPGNDLFFDSCHMTWRGYGAMATSLATHLGPLLDADPKTLDPAALGREWMLPQGPIVEQIVFAYTEPEY